MNHTAFPEGRLPFVFPEDVVRLRADPSLVGTVQRVGWEDPEDAHDDEEQISEREVEVQWLDDSVDVQDFSALEVLDRSFMPGTIVASALRPEGEMGMTIDTRITFALQWAKNNDLADENERVTAAGVPSTLVQPYISSILPNMLVMRVKDGHKGVGVITHIYGSVLVRHSNNAVCRVNNPTPSILKFRNRDDLEDDMLDEAEEHANMLYRPGDKVYARNDWWTEQDFIVGDFAPQLTPSGGRKKRPISDGVVLRVDTESVLVEWLAASINDNTEFDRSEVMLSPSDLIALDHNEHIRMLLGDVVLLRPSIAAFLAQFPNPSVQRGNRIEFIEQYDHLDAESDFSLLQAKITASQSFVKVLWQSGEISDWIESKTLISKENLMDSDFWPGDYVMPTIGPQKVGYVEQVNHVTQMATVYWFNEDSASWNDESENVSTYTIVQHSQYDYRPGDIVLDGVGRVGYVVGFGDKCPLVQHVHDDGTLSADAIPVQHWTLEVVNAPEEDLIDAEIVDEVEDEEIEEELEESDDEYEEGEEGDEDEEAGEGWSTDEEERGPSVVEGVINAFRGLFVRGGGGGYDDDGRDDDGNEEEQKEKESEKGARSTSVEGTAYHLWSPATKEENAIGSFEVHSTAPQDHHFLTPPEQGAPGSAFARKVTAEWRKLRVAGALPPRLYVHAYEDRLDLIRFLIVGAPETVYCDSFFLFDVWLPPKYPEQPPKLFYHASGMRLHPNLYIDGTVCLSLLGTWSGDSSENWNPATSNVLQVALSVQGLILGVKEPYYLEAGYEKLRGLKDAAHAAKLYNERALYLSMRLMLSMVESAAPDVRDVVVQHFLHQGAAASIELCEFSAKLLQARKDGNELHVAAPDAAGKFYLPTDASEGVLQLLGGETLASLRAALDRLKAKPSVSSE